MTETETETTDPDPDPDSDQLQNELRMRYIRIAFQRVKEGRYEDAMRFLKILQRRRLVDSEVLEGFIMDLKNVIQKNRPIISMEDGNSTAPDSTHCFFVESQLLLVQEVLKQKDFYKILNVCENANETEIRKSYKRLLLQLHPDKNCSPDAAIAFQLVCRAFTVLTDNVKRCQYDMARAKGMTWAEFDNSKCPHAPVLPSSPSDRKKPTFCFRHLINALFGKSYRTPKAMQTLNGISTKTLLSTVLVAVFLTFATSILIQSHQMFSFTESSKFNVRHITHRFRIPYFVKPDFSQTFQDDITAFERDIETQFVSIADIACKTERRERDGALIRARQSGNRWEYARIHSIRLKSCDILMRLGEINDLIEKLKATTVSPSNMSDCTTTLLLSEISATKDPKLFDKHELAELFLRLTKSEDTNVRKEAAKCIAEITKSEVQRKKFTKRDIIDAFLNCLRELSNVENMELPIQICRALGNICYLNDEARDIILDLKGDDVLVKLLDITEIRDKENALQFIKVRGGLLSNYLLGGEGLAKRAMELNIMLKLQKIITLGVSDVEKYEDLLLNTLPLLSILTENVADLNFDANLNIQLSRILAASTNPDLAEMCLELLHYQAENDDVKLLLAKDGLCETIYNLLEKYKTLASTSEARALMKLACELIVLILTGDESMHFLYSTPLLKNMEAWLNSEDIDLLTTGVLALGNFARTDSHCIYMVENKVMNKLLDVLAKNNGVKDDVRLQHALLSALRNLVIPKPNKNAVIQAGLVETILPMLEIHQPPVVFKLLGTLRMTVDGQEKLALELLKNKTLIEQLVHWSKSSDYAGVTGESLRLMAWLIKHAYLNRITYALPRKGDAPAEHFAERIPPQDYDRSSLREFIANEGAIEAMINMLISQHLVMQNEALIALCILSVVFLIQPAEACSKNVDLQNSKIDLQDAFIKYEVGKKIAELIKKSSDSMTKEIVENLQNFTNLLKSSPKLVTHLEEHNIHELLKSIPILTEYCTL